MSTTYPMKRSVIEDLIEHAFKIYYKRSLYLPQEMYWTAEDWAVHPNYARDWIDKGLGLDVTNFGRGEMLKGREIPYLPETYPLYGGVLCTLTNGIPVKKGDSLLEKLSANHVPVAATGVSQQFAQKYIMRFEGQRAPYHHHNSKIEDVINLGPGNLMVSVCNKGISNEAAEEYLDRDSRIHIMVNNVWREYDREAEIVLKPGDRAQLQPVHWHSFRAGGPYVIVEEISTVNNDYNDNVWLEPELTRRYPEIIEDQKEITFLLCTELPGTPAYDGLLKKGLVPEIIRD